MKQYKLFNFSFLAIFLPAFADNDPSKSNSRANHRTSEKKLFRGQVMKSTRLFKNKLCIGLLLFPVSLIAQGWEAHYLHPAGAQSSIINSLALIPEWDMYYEVGSAKFNDKDHAMLWLDSAEQAYDFHPGGEEDESYFTAATAVNIAGNLKLSTGEIYGYVVSWAGDFTVIIPPDGAIGTEVNGLSPDGTQAVGSIILASGQRSAAVWDGPEFKNYRNFAPAGSYSSEIKQTVGTVQSGIVRRTVGEMPRATAWHDTPTSIDLQAGLPFMGSYALGVDYATQEIVGYVHYGPGEDQTFSYLWRPSGPSSYQAFFMNPPDSLESKLFGCGGGGQVGYAILPGSPDKQSCEQQGAPSPYEIFHGLLMPVYTASYARTTFADNVQFIYVGGDAYNSEELRHEAVLFIFSAS